MARIRPTEHKAIVALLDSPADSVEDLATDVLLTVERLRADRKDYYVAVVDPGVCVHLHGPYVTKAAAQKAIEKGELFAASPGATGLVLQLHRSEDEGVSL